MRGPTDDDFWLSGVPLELHDLWAPPGVGATVLEAARTAPSPDAPLPDAEAPPELADGIAWAPGALAGVLAQHTGPSSDPEEPFLALVATIQQQARGELRRAALLETYDSLKTVKLATPRDVALALSASRPPETPEETGRYTEAAGVVCGWLVCRGQHRGPVKAGLAAAAFFTWDPLARRAADLGRFTELSAEACTLLRSQEPPDEPALLALGQWHRGWGRIHAVEAILAIESRSDQTDDWLFTTGWDNHVHAGYTAPLVATRVDVASRVWPSVPGDLPDKARLDPARGLLQALLDPHSPGATLCDVPDVLSVAGLWVDGMVCLPTEQFTVADLAFARDLRVYVDAHLEFFPDTSTRQDAWWLAERCTTLLDEAAFRDTVQRALRAADAEDFRRAVALAPAYGLDPVPPLLDRLSRDPDDLSSWFSLTSGHGRRLGVTLVDFAVRVLPAGLVTATGRMPGARNSPDVHAAVFTLWADLGRHDPNTGWRLVEALLGSPEILARRRGAAWLEELPAQTVAARADVVERLVADEGDAELCDAVRAVLARIAPHRVPAVAQTQPEALLRQADDVLCWKGAKMGLTVLTATPGTLVLTTRRLRFGSRDGRTTHEVLLASVTSCTAGRKRALVVAFRDASGQVRALTFGQQLGMPDLQGWVASVGLALGGVQR